MSVNEEPPVGRSSCAGATFIRASPEDQIGSINGSCPRSVRWSSVSGMLLGRGRGQKGGWGRRGPVVASGCGSSRVNQSMLIKLAQTWGRFPV